MNRGVRLVFPFNHGRMGERDKFVGTDLALHGGKDGLAICIRWRRVARRGDGNGVMLEPRLGHGRGGCHFADFL